MKSSLASYLVVSALTFSLANPLQAQTSSVWDAGSGNWSEAANWGADANVPNNGEPDGETYSVTIDNGGSVTLDLNVTLDSLFLAFGELHSTGDYSMTANTVIDFFTFASGTTTLSGTTSLGTSEAPFASLNVSGGAELINDGAFHQTVGEDEFASPVAGYLMLDADYSGIASTFRNTGTYYASVDADLTGQIVAGGGDPGDSQFINEGTFSKTGAGLMEVTADVGFVNSGTVEVSAGELLISGGDNGSTTGEFDVASGAKLSFGGDEVTFGSGSSLTGEGTAEVFSSKVTFGGNSDLSIAQLTVGTSGEVVLQSGAEVNVGAVGIDGGLLNLEADFSFSNATLLSGTIGGSGRFTATGDVAINNMVFEGNGATLTGTTTLGASASFGHSNLAISGSGTEVSNSGVFIQRAEEGTNPGSIVLNEDGGDISSTFRNAEGGTFISNADEGEEGLSITANGLVASPENNRFINEGTFIKRGEGTTSIGAGVGFINSGSLEVEAGRLTLNQGITSGEGSVIVNGGTLDLGSGFSATRIKLAGGSVEQTIGASVDLSDLSQEVRTQSQLSGGIATTATIVAGMVGENDTKLTYTFVASTTESFSFNEARVSDIFRLTSSEEFVFVLEMAPLSGGMDAAYLGWLNEDNLWVNAVLGNQEGSNNASGLQLGYAGSFEDFQNEFEGDISMYIGAYGADENGVWAVLNHNSEYAVIDAIPEPGTWVLMIAGAGALVGLRGRRRA